MINNKVNNKNYIPLTPFKGFVLENFPFIEADFDAITNYELLCLIVKYLNEVISNQNQVQDLGTELVTAYNQLVDYVNNYFNNLDVQDEINNKLDDMVEDETISNIINQEIFGNINSDIADLKQYTDLSKSPTLFIGDSYCVGEGNYALLYKEELGLVANTTYFKYASGGAGFVATGSGGNTFIDLLDDAIDEMTTSQKNSIKIIIVGSCINDGNYSSGSTAIKSAVATFMTKVKNNFPNAKVYIGAFGYRIGQDGSNARTYMSNVVIPSLLECNNSNLTKEPIFLTNSYLWMRNNDYFQNDDLHPNEIGQRVIAKHLIRSLQGSDTVAYPLDTLTVTVKNGDNETFDLSTQITNDNIFIRLQNDTRIYGVNSFNARSFTDLGTWSGKLIHPINAAGFEFPVVVRVYMSSSNDNHFPAILRFSNDGKVYLRIYCKDNYSDIVNMTIMQFNALGNVFRA